MGIHCFDALKLLTYVKLIFNREVLVDLIGNPGCLYEPDSLINGSSSISIFSPLRFPRSTHIDSTVDFESIAKHYFQDSDSLNLVFEDPFTGKTSFKCILLFLFVGDGDVEDAIHPQQSDKHYADMNMFSLYIYI